MTSPDALGDEVNRRTAEQVAASVARRTRQRAVRAALAARRAVGLQRRHARKEKAMATDSKPCGCGDGLLCPQHILLLPAGRRRAPRRDRCRAGLHSPNCPPTCPERNKR
ncbi:hypothetical protein [Solwaraspora sp. WMMD792]|uniref:hypothetical protein n=1 Tax=Solwaraspora sp. WMMD792 TaxID=3016099 RepID=UPI002417B420|nr:hypothetical protein [Solwaraspora sp. WMMD792]MDG4770680.1 hypothetical protein [Solwaraspora sp. WMMD792]